MKRWVSVDIALENTDIRMGPQNPPDINVLKSYFYFLILLHIVQDISPQIGTVPTKSGRLDSLSCVLLPGVRLPEWEL